MVRKKQTQKRTPKKDLLRALNANLSAIEQTPFVRSMADGKEFVCSVCDQPVKPCESDPTAVCGHMVREGTESWLLEQSLRHPEERTPGICIACGGRISPAHLKKDPTAELCSSCTAKAERVRAAHP